ncbi:MAG: MaoC family dehydratase [Microbacterium sp.]|uniref:MaoC family dehydratase n=1 Tax=Microbacterium sp. TaxID=51671 RepID=UPI002632B4B7|nr:MaoC family dehydratase [Microbacterium sp.]MCX6503053.1 MaoC family dehydratase [Microbacterium sp.]
MTTTIAYADVPRLVGVDLGYSDWMEITQARVNTFADATEDHQWIHTDPERAKEGPFGTAVAHGFLTLSLLIPLWSDLLEVEGVGSKVNYGLDKVRFVSPVPVGSRIRLTGVIADVAEVPGGYQLVVDVTIETEGGTKPAVVARSLQRLYA